MEKSMEFIVGSCKAKDLIKTITLAWHGIGRKWVLDETDVELFSKN